MADTVRFIHEAPQKATRKKTRPRLVKACDSWYVPVSLNTIILVDHPFSRTRKLKCDQIIHGTVCRACNEAGLICQFKDRERYYELRQSIGARSLSLDWTMISREIKTGCVRSQDLCAEHVPTALYPQRARRLPPALSLAYHPSPLLPTSSSIRSSQTILALSSCSRTLTCFIRRSTLVFPI